MSDARADDESERDADVESDGSADGVTLVDREDVGHVVIDAVTLTVAQGEGVDDGDAEGEDVGDVE